MVLAPNGGCFIKDKEASGWNSRFTLVYSQSQQSTANNSITSYVFMVWLLNKYEGKHV